MDNKENIEEKQKMEFEKHLRFAQSTISSKAPKETSSSGTSLDYDQLQMALNDTSANVAYLQQVSRYLYTANGVYTRLIEEFTNIPMYDLYLAPTILMGFNGKSMDVSKMNKEYEAIAQLIEKENYKYNFKWFGRWLLLMGELYLYKVEDNNGIFFKMIPNDLCRISGIMENNIYKYSIDMSKLSDEELLLTLPLPIQKAYEQYVAGTLDEEKLDGNFYRFDESEAIAFLFNDGDARTKGVPPFTYLFDKIYKLNEIEDEDLASSLTDNLKILHQKAPTNDEGELLISPEILGIYHRATKSTLPKNIALTTNPLGMEVFTLNRNANNVTTATQKAYENVYTSAGVNSELFNGQRSSNESVLNSIKTDEMVVDRLNGIFGNFLNYEIKNKKKNPMWKVEMLRNTYFNKKDITSMCRDNLAIGGSKMMFLASLGHTPLTGLSMMIWESQMNMNQYFNPVESSYNSSSSEEDNGRPSNAENDNVENGASQTDYIRRDR